MKLENARKQFDEHLEFPIEDDRFTVPADVFYTSSIIGADRIFPASPEWLDAEFAVFLGVNDITDYVDGVKILEAIKEEFGDYLHKRKAAILDRRYPPCAL